MACAVPLAAGAKIGRPEVPVLAFVGDAGLEMGAGELATLAAQKLPVVICVLVDHSLTLIEMKQRASQRPNLGVDFGGPGKGSLTREAQAALARDRFTLIAAHIPRRAYDGAF
jgi:acetolactate synthase-1/2/3 large subunit